MNDWNNGTTYAPQGAFFNRDLQGGVAGLTPGGQQGAFRALGGALQGGAATHMKPKGQPANPLGAAAQGFAGAYSQPEAEKSQAPAEQSGGGGMPGMGFLQMFLNSQNGGGQTMDWRKMLGIGGS